MILELLTNRLPMRLMQSALLQTMPRVENIVFFLYFTQKIQAGGATLKDEQNARITEHQRYTAFLSSSFDLDKAQVQLLRQIGDLESWALGPGKP